MEIAREPLPPIFVAHLFPSIEAKLIELLRSLSPQDWERQTLAPRWNVKDVAAHLLDTQVRKLAAARSKPDSNSKPFTSQGEFISFINMMNENGVREYGRLTPSELISRMETASRESAEYHQRIDPFAPAMFPVSWAGDERSPNWFDTARELTERWHHQQQIRVAVEKPLSNPAVDSGIMTPALYHPVLDCFMRALPHSYRGVAAETGSLAQFNISGDCGGSWYLLRTSDTWTLNLSPVGNKVSETTIPQEIAWRIFTKGIERDVAKSQVSVQGDRKIGGQILEMISIVG